MKKFLTTLSLVLVLALCMSLAAFAAESNVGADNGTANITVNGTFEAGATADKKISVDISWGSMSFVYYGADEGEWDEENHTFEGADDAYWECATDANKITVINHSNSAVEARMTFTKAEGSDIVEVFEENKGTANDGIVELETAVKTAVSNAPKADVYFKIKSGSINATGTLGTITVTIISK